MPDANYPKAVTRLVDEVEALCAVHVGASAPGESWMDTCDRLIALNKLVKAARKAMPKNA